MGLYGAPQAKIDFAAIRSELSPAEEAWFNSEIRVVDPKIEGAAFNRSANAKTRTPVVLWSGPARIQAMRWPNVATTRQEAVSIRTVVFHLPWSAQASMAAAQEGFRVEVINGGEGHGFVGGLFVITSVVNSSYDWDIRVETMHDQGAKL